MIIFPLEYCGIENYEIAITDFNKAIALDPFNADAFYGRGNAYTNLQHYQEALRDYKKALSINPNLKSAQENIDMLQKANIQF